MSEIRIAWIGGLGERRYPETSSNPAVRKFDAFIRRLMGTEPRIAYYETAAAYDLGSLTSLVNNMRESGKWVVIAHSNGGDKANEIANGHFGDIQPVKLIIALDQKPTWENPVEVLEWLNPAFKYPVPKLAEKVIAIHGGFGCGYVDDPRARNIKIDCPHPDFPGRDDVIELIRVNIAASLE